MNFEAYSQRICSLHEFYQNQKPQKIKQKRFQIIKSNMQMVSVDKTQLVGLNNKRFYFSDGIVSLPFGHYLLNNVRKEKERYKNEIQYQIHKKKKRFIGRGDYCRKRVRKTTNIKINICTATVTLLD